MTLTLELPPELEAQLQEVAARSGQAPETFAAAALAATLREATRGAGNNGVAHFGDGID